MQDKWTHILHIADIHIRNFTRHKEYREAFRKLYQAVADTPESTLVYIGGDIVHSKIDISPELIDLTSEFLFNLAELRTTVLIMGNHDANLNNESRLDALSPIINNINHDNLHYLDKAEIYKFGNIDFSVFEIATDKQDDFYSYYSQINADVKKLIECEVVNIQKAYTLEVGDVIKFDDMVVEPFGSDWNNYYMIVSIVRSLGTIKITAREVG